MNLSGILVVVTPRRMAEAIGRLNALPGVEVHHSDSATGKIVVTQEAPTVEDEVEGLRRIQMLPHVLVAEMVRHHLDDGGER